MKRTMSVRTLLQLALLGVVGVGAWHFQRSQDVPAAIVAEPTAPEGHPPQLRRSPLNRKTLASRIPRFEPDTVLNVDGTKVFDHSKFAVTLQNTSGRTVEIESVMLTSVGNAAASGVRDIKGYWHYPQGNHRLGPGEYRYFDKQGFVTDTGHRHVRYVFHTCWHGLGANTRQCRTQWVDTMPHIPNPQ
jgi:hypothetical protein